MKNKGIIIALIIVLSIFAVALTAGFVYLLNNGSNLNFEFSFDEGEMDLVDTVEANSDSINNIDFKLYSTDVEIKQSENENIKVEFYSNNDKNAKIEINEGVIKIDEQENNEVSIGIHNYRRKVILYIPTDYLGEFNITSASGDIRSEIDAANNKTNIVTASGDIKLDVIGESNIVSASGDVIINKAKDILNITTVSGDLRLDMVSKIIKLKTTSGGITINELDIKENSEIESTSGDVNIKNNQCNCYVDTKTMSGDIKVNQFDRKSDIELKIKTVSGDISVN